jgi:hypothetical protein
MQCQVVDATQEPVEYALGSLLVWTVCLIYGRKGNFTTTTANPAYERILVNMTIQRCLPGAECCATRSLLILISYYMEFRCYTLKPSEIRKLSNYVYWSRELLWLRAKISQPPFPPRGAKYPLRRVDGAPYCERLVRGGELTTAKILCSNLKRQELV